VASEPSVISYSVAIIACVNEWPNGRQRLPCSPPLGQAVIYPDTKRYSSAICACAKHVGGQKAHALLAGMGRSTTEPDAICYN